MQDIRNKIYALARIIDQRLVPGQDKEDALHLLEQVRLSVEDAGRVLE